MMCADQQFPVIVVGGGVAGITAALDLAGANCPVHLVEKDAVLGGQTARLDKLYPTDHCAFCPVWTQSRLCLTDPLIRVHTHSAIDNITRIKNPSQDPGQDQAQEQELIRVTISRTPNMIDETLCIFCGKCEEICPENAVLPTFTHALPRSFLVDTELCTRCGKCVELCPTNAVDMTRKVEKIEITAKNIIWATGFADTDISALPEFGYGSHPNIMTSLEFESLTAEAGPNRGEILTPEGKVPSHIAFVQCAGARDQRKFSFCSAVCCMHALKQARWVKRRNPGIEVVIFFTDMRTEGRNYYNYYLDAVEKQSISLVRSRPGLICPLPSKDGIAVRYENTLTGKLNTQRFDMVVLNGALDPCSQNKTGPNKTGPDKAGQDKAGTDFQPLTDDNGFISGNGGSGDNGDQTLSCGFCRAPADVEMSVIQASCAAIHACMGKGTH